MHKKIIGIMLSLVVVIPGMIYPEVTVEAMTLGDMKQELAELEKKQAENKQQQNLTQEQLNAIYGNITNINSELNQIQADMVTMSNEITKYEEEMKAKDAEMKDIINLYQISNGESAYLEYAFGAKDFTDFIYRMAITEQLVNYNKKLIQEYNDMIEANKKRKTELSNKQVTLNNKQEELQKEKAKLGEEMSKFSKESVSIEEEIRLQKEAIKVYEDLKCKDDEDITVCGRDKLPPGTAFFRPIVTGHTTSEFGSRCYTLGGRYVCDSHLALDFTASGRNVPIYSSANGRVIGITERAKCGGNMVYIHHEVNGKTYTTLYAHLRKILVQKGQTVTKDTQIGVMGGDPNTEWWDGCSTGQHVHFGMATGLYLQDYTSWSAFEAHMFNPRILVNAPARGVTFKDRLTKY